MFLVHVFIASTLALLPSANAKNNSDSKASSTMVLVQTGSEYKYIAKAVDLPASRYVGLALLDLDSARNPASQRAGRTGIFEPVTAPEADWPAKPLSGALVRVGNAPFATSSDGKDCRCKTKIGDSDKKRFAALFLSHRFSLPSQLKTKDYEYLSLRVAYRDGVRAYLNGRLIASRNLRKTPELAADRVRGPEWEEFIVPLSAGMLVTDNLLSIEIRPARIRNGVRFDAELSLDKASQLPRGPVLQQVGARDALISFDTRLPVSAKVHYGETASLGKLALSANASLARHHQVKLKGLKPGQELYYRVEFGRHSTEVFRFHTPPPDNEVLHFAVYGDMRGGHRVHAQIVNALQSELVDFVIVTGDLVLRGSDEADWQRFFEVARPLLARLPYYPVAGNHDTGTAGDEARRMNEIFAMWPGPKNRPTSGHWHSFDLSGVHFVMLDSNHYRNDSQRDWLQKDLAQAKKNGVRAIFAAVHAGPYSRGLHRGNIHAAEHYAPLLAQYGVSLLFSGHDHLYQRGKVKGLAYMVSGGGGAPLYSVRCGIKGRQRCKQDDGMQHVAKEYHYIVVSVFPQFVRACPKRVDGSPLEACIRYKLP